MNSWKQPTPTDIRSNPSVDLLSQLIFMYTLNMCQNSRYNKVFYHGNKRVDLTLERGSCLFRLSKFAKKLKLPRSRIKKAIFSLKWYTEVNIETKPYGTIITYLSYDDLIKMNIESYNEETSKRHRRDIEATTKNKSDKNEKNEKSEKKETRANFFSSSFSSSYKKLLKDPNVNTSELVNPSKLNEKESKDAQKYFDMFHSIPTKDALKQLDKLIDYYKKSNAKQ